MKELFSQRRDLNCEPLATALPHVPQPLPFIENTTRRARETSPENKSNVDTRSAHT